MTQRITFQDAPQELLSGLFMTGKFLKKSGLDPKLLALLDYRVSQINGCAYCLDMHFKDAVHLGETEQRLYSVSAWRDTPYYTDKERAALEFAEAVTNANTQDVEDDLFEKMLSFFSKAEIAALTLAITNINAWNRLNKTFKTIPGGYKVGMFD